ncbi:MAG: prolyl oligopeptidase family serine peptidase [Verrucomicrobiota bacterium]
MKTLRISALALVAWLLVVFSNLSHAQPANGYQKPPAEILEALDTPPLPVVTISPARDRLLLAQGVRYPPIAEVAEPMLRLAGVRINPRNNGPHLPTTYIALTLKTVADGREQTLVLPPGARISFPAWSPDGAQFAFARYNSDEIELWVGDAVSGKLRRLRGVALNAAYGSSFEWMPDSRALLCKTIVARRGPPPLPPVAPAAPVVQESAGKSAPVRTFQDLLETPHDEDLFDYYATSQLALVEARSGRLTKVGEPALFAAVDPSPDGRLILVSRIHRPYSYLHTASSFPREVEVWDRAGQMVYQLASKPLADNIPIGGVPTGPRNYHWHPIEPATLAWVEALDRGSERTKAAYRDKVMLVRAPFADKPTQLARTQQRFSSLMWTEAPHIALLRDYQSAKRVARTFVINPQKPGEAPKLIWERSTQDRYHDPGVPLSKLLPNGKRAARVDNNCLFLAGPGASSEGDRPFLDRFDLATFKSERVFQCDDQSYETIVGLVTEDGSRLITRKETRTVPPNYFLRDLPKNTATALTQFTDTTPQLRQFTKQLVTYQRDDGVQLSFTLYLPAGHQPGQRLPTVLWAYPREYIDADTAGQVSGSANSFTSITGISHLFFLTQGYAILDGATMPVVGTSQRRNDTYLDQIVASAKAAIDKAVELGVTDPDRVGVGGHSYGAFMTANLLAHSDLFRAGIARSGAYNRTLTPFGFQNENRTLWQAQETYLKMSPFMVANKINEPVLLIHGEADNNSGTFPIQSERLYQAVKGTGGIARLVMLPHESHAYTARESVEHVLYEMTAWFDKHVKHAPAKAKTASSE